MSRVIYSQLQSQRAASRFVCIMRVFGLLVGENATWSDISSSHLDFVGGTKQELKMGDVLER